MGSCNSTSEPLYVTSTSTIGAFGRELYSGGPQNDLVTAL